MVIATVITYLAKYSKLTQPLYTLCRPDFVDVFLSIFNVSSAANYIIEYALSYAI